MPGSHARARHEEPRSACPRKAGRAALGLPAQGRKSRALLARARQEEPRSGHDTAMGDRTEEVGSNTVRDTEAAVRDGAPTAGPWWRSAAIYQIYPRSFADGNS